MKEQLEQIKAKALADLAAAADMSALDAVRVRVLGKKGELTAVLKQMGKLSAEERPVMGQMANAVRFSDYSDYIRKVTLKAGMFEIPSGAFENCTRLESVNLFSASAIYENAFKNCSSLKDIKITGNVNYISGSAFAGCKCAPGPGCPLPCRRAAVSYSTPSAARMYKSYKI